MTTKQKIYMTALELEEKRDIDRVTVRDIIEASGVSRQTFYYYFHDLEDLFEVVVEEINEKMLNTIQRGAPLEIWLKQFLELLEEKKKLYLRIMYSRFGVKALNGTQDAIRRWLMEYMKQNSDRMQMCLSAQKVLLLLDFYTGGIFNLMRQMVQEECKDMEIMVRLTVSTMNGQLHL